MRIGIDGNNANVKEQVGVSVYTRKLLEYFQKQAHKDLRFTVFLKNAPLDVLPPQTEYFKYEVVYGPVLWSNIFLPFRLFSKPNIDVFFAPAHYSPYYLPCPLVVTIHDVSYFAYPNEFLQKDLYKLKNWTNDSLVKAKKVIAVSKTTKKDIMKWYHTPDSQIEVVYNGFEKDSDSPSPFKDISSEFKIEDKKYMLYVGTLQPRKNIIRLIEAFKKYHETHKDYKLVLVGRKGWLYESIFEKVKELQLEDAVLLTGYLSDSDVITLYRHAFCFVMPSLYEGFGIPILEAMSQGCPVISSFTSSLPEIGGEACLYFDPQSADDLLDKFKIMEQKELQKELVTKGKKRTEDFSWEKCASETLGIIVSAAQG